MVWSVQNFSHGREFKVARPTKPPDLGMKNQPTLISISFNYDSIVLNS